MFLTLAIFISLIVCFSLRAYSILPRSKSRASLEQQRLSRRKTCSLAVFLGSGGHTSEAIALISALDFERYTPRTYVISEGDELSAHKAVTLENVKAGNTQSIGLTREPAYHILVIPRARRVHQSLLTTPPTALRSLLSTFYHLTYLPWRTGNSFAEVLVLNGPGTCVTLCVAAYASKFFGILTPKLIYVESFARVKSLSLSGKLLRPFVDRFVVQWPQLLADGRRGECRGWLV